MQVTFVSARVFLGGFKNSPHLFYRGCVELPLEGIQLVYLQLYVPFGAIDTISNNHLIYCKNKHGEVVEDALIGV